MRKLVILRGVMGSGKSTFIKENNLEIYTLCADRLRLMFNSPELTIDYSEMIPQHNNEKIWKLLYSILEERMKKGEFTIIDAMHLYKDDLNYYKKLAEKYRYRLYLVDFSDISKEELYRRNNTRIDYKKVSTQAIDKALKKLNKETIPSSYKVIKSNEFNEIIMNIHKNCDSYDNIHVIGDIHGCYSVLKKYFEEFPIKENDLYIFLGDYFDKGIENANTFKFLSELIKNKNMIFLLGNHEDKLYKYANEDEFKMDYDISRTIEEFESNNITKSEIRGFIKQLAQMSYIEFKGNKYLITHGGIPYIPNKPLDFYSTNSFVYGIDKYEINIDELYNNYMLDKEEKIYQVHGHRNFYKILIDSYKYSFNLDGGVELGGNLRILNLCNDGSISSTLIKNDIYNSNLIHNEETYDLINELRKSKYIYEKELTNNISSFNFTKEAFFNGVWNASTTKARGLFINTKDYHIVARSYNKFFNIDETKDSRMEVILEKFIYPVSFYLKYNGFLGILSLDNNELLFASKSNISSSHVSYFKNIFYKKYNSQQIDAIKNMMKDNNVSLIFEVIDPINDPHIIEYNQSNIVLLDAIKNTINYEKISYNQLKQFADTNNIFIKELVYTINNRDEVWNMLFEIMGYDYKYNDSYIEGFVLEDTSNFMVKVKTEYYKIWKHLRNKMEIALKDNNFDIKTYGETESHFMEFIKDKYQGKEVDITKINIIDERNAFLNKN